MEDLTSAARIRPVRPWFQLSAAFEFSGREIFAVLSIALLMNFIFIFGVLKLNTFFFLDMTGTALVAVLLGPWWGATVGLITNVVAALIWEESWLDYAPVNIITGLFWGYAGRAIWPVFRAGFREFHIFIRMLGLGTAGGIVASLMAVPIRINFAPHISEEALRRMKGEHLINQFAQWFVNLGFIVPSGSWFKLVLTDVVTNIPDKTLSFSFAMVVAYHLFPRLRWELENEKPDRRYDLYTAPGALLLFIVLYLPAWFAVMFGEPLVGMGAVLWSVPLAASLVFLAFFAKSNRNGLLPIALESRRRRTEVTLPPPIADLWAPYTIVNVLFVSLYAALLGLVIEGGQEGLAPIASVGWSPFVIGAAMFAFAGIISMHDLARRR